MVPSVSASEQFRVEPRLKRCDLTECQAVCCYDGVWLTGDDEPRIREAIRSVPEVFLGLPRVKIVTVRAEVEAGESASPRSSGRKTAVRAFTYRRRPAHFADTRCVFALEDGRCSLQAAAVARGLHPWHWKPLACWLHPLRLTAGNGDRTEILPPAMPGADPDEMEGYAGYATFTPCGRHDADAPVWTGTLSEEVEYHSRSD